MKTLEQLYNEIMKDEALKEKFVAAAKANGLADFLREQDCDASVEDLINYLKGVQEGKLDSDALEKVAGGNDSTDTCDFDFYDTLICTMVACDTCYCNSPMTRMY